MTSLIYEKNKNNEILIGMMLSDAHITGYIKNKNQYYVLQQLIDHEDLIKVNQKEFLDIGLDVITKIEHRKKQPL